MALEIKDAGSVNPNSCQVYFFTMLIIHGLFIFRCVCSETLGPFLLSDFDVIFSDFEIALLQLLRSSLRRSGVYFNTKRVVAFSVVEQ